LQPIPNGGELAVPAHGQQPAGQPAVVDVPGEMLVQPGQPAGVKADLCRFYLGA
jgi:hypothetical protein